MDSTPIAKVIFAVFGLSNWEVVLILAVLILLFCVRNLPSLVRGFKGGDGTDIQKILRELSESRNLWIAQGFGVGRIPFAPGTFGSLVGLLWFALLLKTGNFWLYLAGMIFGFALSVWLCGAAEKILKQSDPSSVVLDEIVAIPLCFLAIVTGHWMRHGRLPEPESFLSAQTWYIPATVFVLFRIFDILKPWPIRQSQNLPGGWGVTVDDLLAAICVATLTLIFVLR